MLDVSRDLQYRAPCGANESGPVVICRFMCSVGDSEALTDRYKDLSIDFFVN